MNGVHGVQIFHTHGIGGVGAGIFGVKAYHKIDGGTTFYGRAAGNLLILVELAEYVVGGDVGNVDQATEGEAAGREFRLCLAHGIAHQVGHGDLLGHYRVDGEQHPAALFYLAAGSRSLGEDSTALHAAYVHGVDDIHPDAAVAGGFTGFGHAHVGEVGYGDFLAVLGDDAQYDIDSQQDDGNKCHSQKEVFDYPVFKESGLLFHSTQRYKYFVYFCGYEKTTTEH